MHTWKSLIVTDSDGNSDTLSNMVADSEWIDEVRKARLDARGAISEWADYFISLPGEEPDSDTPRSPVDWSGFREAISPTQEQLTEVIRWRCSPEQKAQVTRKAQEAGQTISEYIRSRVLTRDIPVYERITANERVLAKEDSDAAK